MYDSCYEWIQGELKNVDVPYIEIVRSAEELADKNMADYSVLFIGGGNTFKLLNVSSISFSLFILYLSCPLIV